MKQARPAKLARTRTRGITMKTWISGMIIATLLLISNMLTMTIELVEIERELKHKAIRMEVQR